MIGKKLEQRGGKTLQPEELYDPNRYIVVKRKHLDETLQKAVSLSGVSDNRVDEELEVISNAVHDIILNLNQAHGQKYFCLNLDEPEGMKAAETYWKERQAKRFRHAVGAVERNDCEECGSLNLKRESGCIDCIDCGWSACG